MITRKYLAFHILICNFVFGLPFLDEIKEVDAEGEGRLKEVPGFRGTTPGTGLRLMR
jgi:hypothetical protein